MYDIGTLITSNGQVDRINNNHLTHDLFTIKPFYAMTIMICQFQTYRCIYFD